MHKHANVSCCCLKLINKRLELCSCQRHVVMMMANRILSTEKTSLWTAGTSYELQKCLTGPFFDQWQQPQ